MCILENRKQLVSSPFLCVFNFAFYPSCRYNNNCNRSSSQRLNNSSPNSSSNNNQFNYIKSIGTVQIVTYVFPIQKHFVHIKNFIVVADIVMGECLLFGLLFVSINFCKAVVHHISHIRMNFYLSHIDLVRPQPPRKPLHQKPCNRKTAKRIPNFPNRLDRRNHFWHFPQLQLLLFRIH